MINSNIPLPTRQAKVPWTQLQIGDSLDLPAKQVASIRSQMRRSGKTCVTSTQGTPEFPLASGLVRLWRSEDKPYVPPAAKAVAPVQSTDTIVDPTITTEEVTTNVE